MKILTTVENSYTWATSPVPVETPNQVEELYNSLEGEELTLFNSICEGLPCAKLYMEKHFEEYGWSRDDIALARIYTPVKLPTPIEYFQKHWHCFENSFAYAEKMGYGYVEGIAINPSGPYIHAWNTTTGDDVLDLTWPFQHVNKYFGIEFDTEKLRLKGYMFGAYFGHLHDRTKKKQSSR